MYAYDLLLISASVIDLRMLDACSDVGFFSLYDF